MIHRVGGQVFELWVRQGTQATGSGQVGDRWEGGRSPGQAGGTIPQVGGGMRPGADRWGHGAWGQGCEPQDKQEGA